MELKLPGKSGFTMVELMIVVVIIGLLTAIAMPNFMSYQAKTRQSEAKAGLGGIFTNEQAYFSEKNFYVMSINQIGFGLAGKAKHYDFTITSPAFASTTSITFYENSWIGKHGTPGDGPAGNPQLGLENLPGAGPISFTAIAAGDIDGDPAVDCWVISHDGWIGNTHSDIYNN